MKVQHWAFMVAVVLVAYIVGRKYPTLLPSIGGF